MASFHIYRDLDEGCGNQQIIKNKGNMDSVLIIIIIEPYILYPRDG